VNSKERIHAAFEGRPVDRMPVAVPYIYLYHVDHFAELTGLPQMQSFAWRFMEPTAHTEIVRKMVEAVNFDIVQPSHNPSPSRSQRENLEFRQIEGHLLRVDRRTGEQTVLDPISGHAFDEAVNETQFVFDLADARDRVVVTPAEKMATDGWIDYQIALVEALGKERFILSGGVLGTFYACVEAVGLTNLFYLAAAQPDLIDYLCRLNLDKNLEFIRMLAMAGGDAIYIDDATATNDMVSRKTYERFSLPYIRPMVDEIHRLGHKAVVIYFGGVADRLDLIAESGADALIMETSMKNYVNDIDEIAPRIGSRMTLYGNIDPVHTLQEATDAELEAEIRRQVAAGKKARGFVLSTGSPLTPSTPLSRVRHMIEYGRSL
jgi:uroporphyrinogen-III decarboxylase